ncbi:MAG TPA: amidohydrolase family protein [Pseudonocardiaceae bacterium]
MIVDGHVTLGRVDGVEVEVGTLLNQMDRAGVDLAVVSPDPRETAVAHREGHDRLLELREQYPERLAVYATANPWLGASAVDELDRALSAGAVAIKLHPYLQGFQPIEPIVEPIMELAAARGVPVYVHSGTPVQATPFQVAALADRFPGVPVILGRGGKTDFKADAAPALKASPNLYGDTAHDFPLTGMATQLAAAGPRRLLFTSDFPYGDMCHELRRARALPAGDAALRDVLGGNLLRLLKAEPMPGEPG